MRRYVFLTSVAVFGVVVHLGFVGDLLGSGATEFVRRQSEAYAIVVLVIGFWELFARRGHPGNVATRDHPIATSMLWFSCWFGALIITSLLLPRDIGLPQSIATLKEAFAAALVISAYLSWSHSFSPGDTHWALGAPVRSAAARVSYYAAIAALVLVSAVGLPDTVIGASYSDFIEQHSEAVGAVILIPLYFDVVARASGQRTLIVWLGLIVGVPLAVQLDVWPDVADSTVEWGARMTEAFLAALAISLYFEFIHRVDATAAPDVEGREEGELDPAIR